MQVRQNVIISHGGKHGRGGTYLAGSSIGEDRAHIPEDLIGETGSPSPAPPAPAPAAQGASHPAPSTEETSEEDDEQEQAPAASGSAAPGTPRRRGRGVPTTRRGVQRLTREEAVALSRDALGVEVVADEPLERIHERLIAGLSIG